MASLLQPEDIPTPLDLPSFPSSLQIISHLILLLCQAHKNGIPLRFSFPHNITKTP